MLMTRNLHEKSSEVSIETRSPPASLSFKGQATKHTTVEWSILKVLLFELITKSIYSSSIIIVIIKKVTVAKK